MNGQGEAGQGASRTGRLTAKDSRATQHMTANLLKDERHFVLEQLTVDAAHTVMLAEQGILTPDQSHLLVAALRKGKELAAAGTFPLDPEGDSLLPQAINFYVAEAGSDAGGRLHTGRSRIDAIAAVNRLFARNQLMRVHRSLRSLMEVVLDLAGKHHGDIMPGWSHLQHAQPWVLGHYFLKTFSVLARHAERVRECYARTNRSALGGAALVGSGWALDRRRVADLLGHDGLVYNSMDAGLFTSDWVIEYNAVLAMLMNDIGRSASDLFIWHTWEFGLAELDDGFCSTSTLMPQKKNAGSAEYLRGCAGSAVGWFASAAAVSRSATTIDCDIHYSPDLLVHPAKTTWHCLELLSGIYSTTNFKTATMKDRAGVHWSTASGLADSIVKETGITFRDAHRTVATLVRNSLAEETRPSDVTGEHLNRAARETIGRSLDLETAWVKAQLDPERFVETRVTEGSVNPAEIEKQILMAQDALAENNGWAETQQGRIDHAGHELERSLDQIAAGKS